MPFYILQSGSSPGEGTIPLLYVVVFIRIYMAVILIFLNIKLVSSEWVNLVVPVI